jgi:hypothetical protein
MVVLTRWGRDLLLVSGQRTYMEGRSYLPDAPSDAAHSTNPR